MSYSQRHKSPSSGDSGAALSASLSKDSHRKTSESTRVWQRAFTLLSFWLPLWDDTTRKPLPNAGFVGLQLFRLRICKTQIYVPYKLPNPCHFITAQQWAYKSVVHHKPCSHPPCPCPSYAMWILTVNYCTYNPRSLFSLQVLSDFTKLDPPCACPECHRWGTGSSENLSDLLKVTGPGDGI